MHQVLSNHAKCVRSIAAYLSRPSHYSVDLGFSLWERYVYATLSKIHVKSIPLSIIERLGKIVAHPYRLQSGNICRYSILLHVPIFLTLQSGNQTATGNINQEVYRDDNPYFIFHEYSAFGLGEGQNLQAVRDFISYRTDPARRPTERLHAVW
jgi:hypothetical protein